MPTARGKGLALLVCLVTGVLILHTAITGHHSTINISGSLPQWVFSCRPYDPGTRLTVGMYVRFLPPQRAHVLARTTGVTLPTNIRWIKQVTAVDASGVFVQGTHPDSFDSRHWGALLPTEIQEVCTPWW
jgi:type IV secretory pathway protease TraF